ncbi:MAG: geranylgeranylglyceryl/heptaprenylglyceryl phosphate synthase [Desulfurococcales archaeon]|jgi:phosphoglycerol geranylgeranyltransferase|nr:geranylgeranylglyceryl/heptaprenylglyceryl phosphate synthase [Desulfurococcales archaeon]
MNQGKVEKYLLERRKEGPLHLSLIDPDKTNGEKAEKIGDMLASVGTDAFLVGGSTGVCPFETEQVVRSLKKTGLPVIIFPGGLSNIVPSADAILYMSLLNSDDPYFIIGAHIQGCLLIKKYNIETIPTAYIIVGHGGAAGHVGKARPVPYENPELAALYVLAGSMLGMRFAYLEAGSGAPYPVPPQAVVLSKKLSPETFVIVGGGIRDPKTAYELVKAGADAIVTGTIIEKDPEALREIIKTLSKT